WRLVKNYLAGPRGAFQCGRGARAPRHRRVFSRLDIYDYIALANVIAYRSALIRHSLGEQNINRAQIAHGRLRIGIKLAQRFDFISEELQPEWQRRLPRM